MGICWGGALSLPRCAAVVAQLRLPQISASTTVVCCYFNLLLSSKTTASLFSTATAGVAFSFTGMIGKVESIFWFTQMCIATKARPAKREPTRCCVEKLSRRGSFRSPWATLPLVELIRHPWGHVARPVQSRQAVSPSSVAVSPSSVAKQCRQAVSPSSVVATKERCFWIMTRDPSVFATCQLRSYTVIILVSVLY